jgi:hypothetical protein
MRRRRRNPTINEIDWTPIIIAGAAGIVIYIAYSEGKNLLTEFETWLQSLFTKVKCDVAQIGQDVTNPIQSSCPTVQANLTCCQTNIFSCNSPSTSGSGGLEGCGLC